MIEIVEGNIFESDSQTIVNTVNCVGAMGKGIALEYKKRYPDMFLQYKNLCEKHLLKTGLLWLYKTPDKWILNFPTKDHWRSPSKIEYLETGLDKFVKTYKEKEISSISFPLLGASNGGIPPNVSFNIMHRYLIQCDIPIKIYKYYDYTATHKND